MATSAVDRELPELGPITGPALAPESALHALEDNKPTDADDENDAAPPGEPAPPPAPAVEPERARPSKRASAPPPAKPADRAKDREKKARKLKRDELEVLYLSAESRIDELQDRVVAAERKAAVHQAVNNDVVNEATDDLVGLVVDGLEAGAQLLVREQYARVVALEDDERETVTRLGSRCVRHYVPTVAEQSPAWALAAAVISIAAAKVVAIRLAKVEERERLEASQS